MRNVLCIALIGMVLVGCKTTLERNRGAFIERCMEKRVMRGEVYVDALSVCEDSADRFIGKAQ